MKELLSVDFLKFFVPLVGAVIAWFWNEGRKRADEEYIRKEKRYENLIECLRGFYVGLGPTTNGFQLREKFLVELNKTWLYCPDDVIKKAYAFLATVHTDRTHTDEEKELAVGEFIIAVRKDLLSHGRTRNSTLTAKDFKHLKAN